MESRGNYAAIGLFVLVMLMTGLGFVFWLTNAGEKARQADIRIVFEGAVTGLNTGSSVLFNGIKVGEVRQLRLDENDPKTVVAVISVDRSLPIRIDTQAILSYQGLTGVASLQLEGGSRNAPLLLDSVDPGGIPTIQAEVSPFQDIIKNAQNVLTNADSAMTSINVFITENGPAFNRTVNNVETFSRSLAENAPAISGALASFGELSDTVGRVAEDLSGTVTQAEAILKAVDPAEVSTLTANLSRSAERLDRVLARAEEVAGGIDPAVINEAVRNVADASKILEETLARADALVGSVDPADVDAVVKSLRQTSDGLGAAARRANGLVASVDGEKVARIVDQVEATTKALSDVSGTVGGVVGSARTAMDQVNAVVSAVDPGRVRGAVEDVSTFATALRDASPRIDGILADVKTASEGLRSLGETIKARSRDVDVTITDVRNLVAQLNGIATRTDGVLRKIDAYVEGDGNGLIQEATETLASIRSVADTLNQRIGPITDNVAQFTDRGLDSFTGLAEDGRRALSRLERVLGGIERNPQQFLFGGEGVPEYSPRRR